MNIIDITILTLIIIGIIIAIVILLAFIMNNLIDRKIMHMENNMQDIYNKIILEFEHLEERIKHLENK